VRTVSRAGVRVRAAAVLVLALMLVGSSPVRAYDTPDGPSGVRAFRPDEPGFNPNAHGLFTLQAITILRNDGHREAADVFQHHLGALLDGLRAADQAGGRIVLDVGVAEWSFARNAFTHFYEVDHHRGLTIPFVPDIPLLGPSRWYVLRGPHPRADRVADWHYARAVQALRAGHTYEAFHQLGYVIHLLQDVFVPQHVKHSRTDWFDVTRRGFQEGSHPLFETWANANAPRFLVDRGGYYQPGWTAGHFVQDAAAVAVGQLANARNSRNYDRAAQNTFPQAQRYTAGLLLKFHQQWPTEPYSAVRLTVRQVEGLNWYIDPIVYTPDFYAELNSYAHSAELGGRIMDGFRTGYILDDNWAWPADPVEAWSFHVWACDANSVGLELSLWDSDRGRGHWLDADDHVDISPSRNHYRLDLHYWFSRPDGTRDVIVEDWSGATHRATAPAPGTPARAELAFEGETGDVKDRARIRFVVEAVHVPRLTAEEGARLRQERLVEVVGPPPGRPVVTPDPLWSRGDRLYARWRATLPAGASPVEEYQYQVLTAPLDNGAIGSPLTLAQGWTSAGLREEAAITGFRLRDLNAYFIEVRARNRAGWSSVGRSEVVRVDSRAPTLSIYRFEQTTVTRASGRPPHMLIRTHPNSLLARWHADDSWVWTGGRVEGSGIAQYTYHVRVWDPVSGNWREVASGRTTATSLTLPDLPLRQGSQCSLSLLAHDRAGNPGEWVGATFTVAFTDTTPPPAPVPRIAAVTSNTYQVVWDDVEDPESGVYRYEFGIGTRPDRADVLPWVDKGKTTQHILRGFTLRARAGVSYYLLVRVTNGAVLDTIGASGPLPSIP